MSRREATPKYLISTSLRPSKRARSFGRDLSHALINARYVTRGKRRIIDLVGLASSLRATRLIVIQAKKGNPSKLDFYHVGCEGSYLLGSLLILGVKLVREQKHVIRAPPRARLSMLFDVFHVVDELRRATLLLPTLFDLDLASEEDRWVMKISGVGEELSITFMDRETTSSFGPVIRVRKIVRASS